MDDRNNPTHEWNQNIIRNLKANLKDDFAEVSESDLLQRYDDWGRMGLSDEDDGLIEYLKTGE